MWQVSLGTTYINSTMKLYICTLTLICLSFVPYHMWYGTVHSALFRSPSVRLISSESREVHCNFNFFHTVELTFLYLTILLDAFLEHPVFLESLFFFSCHLTAPYFYWLPNVTALIFIVSPVFVVNVFLFGRTDQLLYYCKKTCSQIYLVICFAGALRV